MYVDVPVRRSHGPAGLGYTASSWGQKVTVTRPVVNSGDPRMRAQQVAAQQAYDTNARTQAAIAANVQPPTDWGTFTGGTGIGVPIVFHPSARFLNAPKVSQAGMPIPHGFAAWSEVGREILAAGPRIAVPRPPTSMSAYSGAMSGAPLTTGERRYNAVVNWAMKNGHVSFRGSSGAFFTPERLALLAVFVVPFVAAAVGAAGAAAASSAATTGATTTGAGVTAGSTGAGMTMTAGQVAYAPQIAAAQAASASGTVASATGSLVTGTIKSAGSTLAKGAIAQAKKVAVSYAVGKATEKASDWLNLASPPEPAGSLAPPMADALPPAALTTQQKITIGVAAVSLLSALLTFTSR